MFFLVLLLTGVSVGAIYYNCCPRKNHDESIDEAHEAVVADPPEMKSDFCFPVQTEVAQEIQEEEEEGEEGEEADDEEDEEGDEQEEDRDDRDRSPADQDEEDPGDDPLIQMERRLETRIEAKLEELFARMQ